MLNFGVSFPQWSGSTVSLETNLSLILLMLKKLRVKFFKPQDKEYPARALQIGKLKRQREIQEATFKVSFLSHCNNNNNNNNNYC